MALCLVSPLTRLVIQRRNDHSVFKSVNRLFHLLLTSDLVCLEKRRQGHTKSLKRSLHSLLTSDSVCLVKQRREGQIPFKSVHRLFHSLLTSDSIHVPNSGRG